jgi:Ser/Thr protein kinase RdoA (MazF antagonist)
MSTPPIPDPAGPPTPPDPEAVCRAFDLGRPRGVPVVAARGELGRIWRLETERGPWAVKELLRFDGATVVASARADVAFQEIAIAAGIPMPRPVRSTRGEVLVDLGEAVGTRFVRVYTWVELAARTATPPLDVVAAILGRLHRAAPPDARPMDRWYVTPPPPGVWPGRQAAARRSGATWADALDGLVPILLETTAATGPVRARRRITCHLDFNPDNVLVDVAGGVVVVDWENSGPASAEQELASGLAQFVRDPSDMPAFLAAYEAAGGIGRLVDRASFAMTMVVDANLVETYSRWALDPASSDEDRARAAFWIEDIAANTFTLDRVDAWLAAAGARTGA